MQESPCVYYKMCEFETEEKSRSSQRKGNEIKKRNRELRIFAGRTDDDDLFLLLYNSASFGVLGEFDIEKRRVSVE